MEIEIKFNETFEAPMGSPRPRFRNTGRFVQTYMQTAYTNHKAYIQGQMPKLNLERALKIELDFYFPLLKSWSKKKKREMVGQYKVTKPDIDNLIKTVLDACNGHVWKDDNQITEITSSKRYGLEPKIIMRVEEVI
ncbi:endodeoxyribonuclease RusA family protein [Staphylococcus aureus 1101-1 2011]|uniref:RusA family crossover junction endodeoxyribonuclease n=1 Tax=Staphylococcus aureus TaxID=1280 RepID=UPI0004D618C6|nr:RusA family crossover junction endodeoxyribonuclease [Staphylococcus aureus]KEK60705.1 endodeoxyribonuclease RusA family protein [Staphylococcus aureus 1101-1 2011]